MGGVDRGAIRYMATHGAKRKQKQVPKEYLSVGRFGGKIGKLHVDREGIATVDAAEVSRAYGCNALSSRVRVKKHLYDAARKFSSMNTQACIEVHPEFEFTAAMPRKSKPKTARDLLAERIAELKAAGRHSSADHRADIPPDFFPKGRAGTGRVLSSRVNPRARFRKMANW